MIRLDKFLADSNVGSRREVKNFIKDGKVLIGEKVIKQPEYKVLEGQEVTVMNRSYRYEPFAYFMFHKPAGIVSATKDLHDITVIDYLKEEPVSSLFPVGRLDKDTEGLLLITNDGKLGHQLTSPNYFVPKRYYVELNKALTEEVADCLRNGVDIGEKEITRPADVSILGEKKCEITITEGKFHQVKRMFMAVDYTVLYLKRIAIGDLLLDSKLKKGSYRRLTKEEIDYLKSLS